MKEYSYLALWIFNLTYLFWGAAYFIQDLNIEFVIYVAVIFVIVGGVLLISEHANFPHWQLWLLSVWGIMHILGGAVETTDGALFAYRIYPVLDLGGEFYILKYDQLVHGYLYGLVALMSLHVLQRYIAARTPAWLVALLAVMTAVGVSTLNEIMEFIISLNLENGVGGYENTMLDIIFNLLGAILAITLYKIISWKIRA